MAGRFAFALGEHIARLMQQTLAVFELPQFGRRVDLDVGIGSNTPTTARLELTRGIENAVTQIGLCYRTEAGCCARCCQPMGFVGGHVRAMNETPPIVDAAIVEKPLDRPRSQRFDAFIDLSRLFCGVDVDWSLRLQCDNGL